MFRRARIAREGRGISSRQAGVAQLVEQLIRNQQVLGSSPSAGSNCFSKLSLSCDASHTTAQRAKP